MELRLNNTENVAEAECAVPSRAGGIYRAICTKMQVRIEFRGGRDDVTLSTWPNSRAQLRVCDHNGLLVRHIRNREVPCSNACDSYNMRRGGRTATTGSPKLRARYSAPCGYFCYVLE